MIARLVAWAVLIALGAGIYHYGADYKNPWSTVAASPVLSMLPPASDGCGKKCKE